jgi:hypothetical protein
MIGSHSQFGGLRANIRLMFQAMITRLYSLRTFSRPRSKNWLTRRVNRGARCLYELGFEGLNVFTREVMKAEQRPGRPRISRVPCGSDRVLPEPRA